MPGMGPIRHSEEQRVLKRAGALPGTFLRFPTRTAAACLAFGVVLVVTAAAQAQQSVPSPSQVAPPVAPAAPAASARIVLPQVEAGATIPPGAEELSFTLEGFAIEGEFAELVQARRALEAGLVGKQVSVARLFEFAASLQAAYVNAGYPIVRVVVTPQELDKAATVKLRIIDGFVLRVDAGAVAENVRGQVLRMVADLIGRRRLRQAELERKLLLAGEMPGLALNAIFTPATQENEPGGVVLVLTGRYRPISASLYADNSLPSAFGTGQIVGSASLNSVFGLGERLTVTAAGLPDSDYGTGDPTRRYVSAIASIPIGTDGLMVEAGITRGTTTPRVGQSSASQGDLTQSYAELSFAAVKTRAAGLTLSTRLDVTDERLDTLAFGPPITLSLDRVRVLRIGADGFMRWQEAGTVIGYGAIFSRGLNGFGARSEKEATPYLPLSRFGADAVFNKLQGHIDITQSLPASFFLSLSAAGQGSFNRPLLNSEQFGITGARLLSGYAAGTFSGDAGWAVRGEVGRAFNWENALLPVAVTPYLFAATGERRLEKPTILEQPRVRARNAGLGLRFNGATQGEDATGLSSFIEASKRDSDDGTREGWRLFVGGALHY